MDLKKHVLKENSRANWIQVVDYVGDNPNRFRELMDIFTSTDYRMVQRVSQAIGIIGERQPHLITPYFPTFIELLNNDPIDAVKRNIMRIFQYIDIPENYEGEVFDLGLSYLKSIETPIAVKAFAMTSLRKICQKYPELTNEVILLIEILVKEKVSAGIISRGSKELKLLNKIASTI